MAASLPLKRLRVVSAIVAVAALGWIGYETIHAGSDVPPQPSSQALTRLTGGAVNGRRIDGKSWSLDYENATLSADGTIAEIDNVHDGVLLRAGKPYMKLRAKHVTANIGASDFTVRVPVSFREIGGQGRTLETVDAHYLGFSQTLVLAHPTTIHEGPLTIAVSNVTINFKSGHTTLGRIKAVQ